MSNPGWAPDHPMDHIFHLSTVTLFTYPFLSFQSMPSARLHLKRCSTSPQLYQNPPLALYLKCCTKCKSAKPYILYTFLQLFTYTCGQLGCPSSSELKLVLMTVHFKSPYPPLPSSTRHFDYMDTYTCSNKYTLSILLLSNYVSSLLFSSFRSASTQA